MSKVSLDDLAAFAAVHGREDSPRYVRVAAIQFGADTDRLPGT